MEELRGGKWGGAEVRKGGSLGLLPRRVSVEFTILAATCLPQPSSTIALPGTQNSVRFVWCLLFVLIR